MVKKNKNGMRNLIIIIAIFIVITSISYDKKTGFGCLSGGDSGIQCRQNNEMRGCNDINKVCCYTFKEGMNYATHTLILKTDCIGEGTSIVNKDYCNCNC